MRLEEDNGSAVPPTEDDLDKFVSKNAEIKTSTFVKVKENINLAQAKQQDQYFKRKNKGFKSFNLKPKDVVYKRNLKNIQRKGGKMDPLWLGPYQILDIDNNRRVKLMDIKTKKPLKALCAWEQLKPVRYSELHNQVEIIQNDNLQKEVDLKEELNDNITDIEVDNQSDSEVLNHSMGSYPSSEARFSNLVGSTDWVSSDEVDDVHQLIKKEVEFAGLQSTLVFSNPRCHYMIKPAPCDTPFMQILNKGGNHWIVISNIMTDSNVVEVYDSGYNSWQYTAEHTALLNLQMSCLLKTESEFIDVRFADVQQQTDGHNCGFFSFAFCASLLKNEDPRKINYFTEYLRPHMSACIHNGSISKFPSENSERKHSGYFCEYRLDIHCICRLPARNNMIICKSCFKQFHSDCIKFSSTGIYYLFILFKQNTATFLILSQVYEITL